MVAESQNFDAPWYRISLAPDEQIQVPSTLSELSNDAVVGNSDACSNSPPRVPDDEEEEEEEEEEDNAYLIPFPSPLEERFVPPKRSSRENSCDKEDPFLPNTQTQPVCQPVITEEAGGSDFLMTEISLSRSNLDKMFLQLTSGRKGIYDELGKAKEEVRSAIEAKTTAEMELETEQRLTREFLDHFGDIIGEEWKNAILDEADGVKDDKRSESDGDSDKSEEDFVGSSPRHNDDSAQLPSDGEGNASDGGKPREHDSDTHSSPGREFGDDIDQSIHTRPLQPWLSPIPDDNDGALLTYRVPSSFRKRRREIHGSNSEEEVERSIVEESNSDPVVRRKKARTSKDDKVAAQGLGDNALLKGGSPASINFFDPTNGFYNSLSRNIGDGGLQTELNGPAYDITPVDSHHPRPSACHLSKKVQVDPAEEPRYTGSFFRLSSQVGQTRPAKAEPGLLSPSTNSGRHSKPPHSSESESSSSLRSKPGIKWLLSLPIFGPSQRAKGPGNLPSSQPLPPSPSQSSAQYYPPQRRRRPLQRETERLRVDDNGNPEVYHFTEDPDWNARRESLRDQLDRAEIKYQLMPLDQECALEYAVMTALPEPPFTFIFETNLNVRIPSLS